jgi:hypothetical protein
MTTLGLHIKGTAAKETKPYGPDAPQSKTRGVRLWAWSRPSIHERVIHCLSLSESASADNSVPFLALASIGNRGSHASPSRRYIHMVENQYLDVQIHRVGGNDRRHIGEKRLVV